MLYLSERGDRARKGTENMIGDATVEARKRSGQRHDRQSGVGARRLSPLSLDQQVGDTKQKRK